MWSALPDFASESGRWSDLIETPEWSSEPSLSGRSGWSSVPHPVDVLDPSSHPALSIAQWLCQNFTPGPRPDFLGGR